MHQINKNNFIFLLSLIILLISGCEKAETINGTDKDYPFYLEAYLETGQYAFLHISKTTALSQVPIDKDTNSLGYMDADSAIRFYKNLNIHASLLKDGVVVDSLTGPFGDGLNCWENYLYYSIIPKSRWWYLKGNTHKIEAGGNYQMVVKIGSNPEMVASCKVPEKVDIQVEEGDIAHGCPYICFDGIHYYATKKYKLTFRDPPQKNYYTLECYGIVKEYTKTKQWPLTGWITGAFDVNPSFENNLFIQKYRLLLPNVKPIFSDKLFNDNQESMVIIPGVRADSLLCINLVSISQGYYERLKSTFLYNKNIANRFSSPVQVYSNFTNAVGFLAGRTVSSDTVVLRPSPFPSAFSQKVRDKSK